MDSAVVARRADSDFADPVPAARLHLETFYDGHEFVSDEAHVLGFQRAAGTARALKGPPG